MPRAFLNSAIEKSHKEKGELWADEMFVCPK